mmetsp:Transcript_6892/g.29084  ORF Transcript_6892/g.29084 Transcript_6892/m.29084 type:complete len:266 (+) Transcript_6892:2721-3518(+)
MWCPPSVVPTLSSASPLRMPTGRACGSRRSRWRAPRRASPSSGARRCSCSTHALTTRARSTTSTSSSSTALPQWEGARQWPPPCGHWSWRSTRFRSPPTSMWLPLARTASVSSSPRANEPPRRWRISAPSSPRPHSPPPWVAPTWPQRWPSSTSWWTGSGRRARSSSSRTVKCTACRPPLRWPAPTPSTRASSPSASRVWTASTATPCAPLRARGAAPASCWAPPARLRKTRVRCSSSWPAPCSRPCAASASTGRAPPASARRLP